MTFDITYFDSTCNKCKNTNFHPNEKGGKIANFELVEEKRRLLDCLDCLLE